MESKVASLELTALFLEELKDKIDVAIMRLKSIKSLPSQKMEQQSIHEIKAMCIVMELATMLNCFQKKYHDGIQV